MVSSKNKDSSSGPSIFVTQISAQSAEELKQGLISQGFEITKPLYTHFCAKKKGVTCTMYISGKLVVQGKEKESFIQFYLEPEILKDFRYSIPEAIESHTIELARIGVDESGKGDFFGPLCIAGVFADADAVARLKSLGVRDSKSLTDSTIRKIAPQISQQFIHYVIKIGPQKYNELYAKFHNLNTLLAWGHATVIEQLSQRSGCTKVIIDQFAHESVVQKALRSKKLDLELTQMHKAESDSVVAAASILARYAYISALEKLEKVSGLPLPKGASSTVLEVGKKLFIRGGQELLQQVAKMHFRTAQQIQEQIG